MWSNNLFCYLYGTSSYLSFSSTPQIFYCGGGSLESSPTGLLPPTTTTHRVPCRNSMLTDDDGLTDGWSIPLHPPLPL